MAISALPADTVRAIGSSQSLTDACSVVKELIDNSLDAGATAVFVDISSNTLDKIRVRDNGHGIFDEDREMACKRHCTSKIQSLDDLAQLGGQSLGFRGEALASAAEMSTKITLTTRIQGEATASEIEYDRLGLLKRQKKVSHSVGTTVQIDKYLSYIPVRRQAAERSATKSLSRIKRLLQAYTFAHPHIRFSLKILKSDKQGWNYTPRLEESLPDARRRLLLDACVQLHGRNVADNCQYLSSAWSSQGSSAETITRVEGNSEADETKRFTFEGLVATKDCLDKSLLNGSGQYISIDSRPLSASRSALRHIIDHYKVCLRSVTTEDARHRITDPLLVLNIVCPKGSYDVNVEPAKDDVLFINADMVLQMAQRALNEVYGEPKADSSSLNVSRNREGPPSSPGFDVLLANRGPSKDVAPADRNVPTSSLKGSSDTTNDNAGDGRPIAEPQCSNRMDKPVADDTGHGEIVLDSHHHDQDLIRGPSKQLGSEGSLLWRPSLCADDDCVDPMAPESNRSDERIEDASTTDIEMVRKDVNLFNPWTLTKIHASDHSKMPGSRNAPSWASRVHLMTPQRQSGDIDSEDGSISDEDIPLLEVSDPFPYPIKARSKKQHPGNLSETPTRLVSRHPGAHGKDAEAHRPYPPDHNLDSSRRGMQPRPESEADTAMRHDGPFIPSSRLLGGTMLKDIPEFSSKRVTMPARHESRQSSLNKPFISPVNDPERVWFERGGQSSRHTRPRRPSQRSTDLDMRDNGVSASAGPATASMDPDLVLSLDYETRKAKATQDHRLSLRKEKAAADAREKAQCSTQRTLDSFARPHIASSTSRTSPHKNRYHRAIAALHEADQTSADSPSIPRQHVTQCPSFKLRRPKGSLSSEPVHITDRVSDLILTLSTSCDKIVDEMEIIAEADDYIYQAEITDGFAEIEASLVHAWKTRLRQLVQRHYRKEKRTSEASGDSTVRSVTDSDLDLDLNINLDLSSLLGSYAQEIE